MASQPNLSNMFAQLVIESDVESDNDAKIDAKIDTNKVIPATPPNSPVRPSNIIPFKGIATAVLRKLDDEDFPALGSQPKRTENKTVHKSKKPKNKITYVVGNNYVPFHQRNMKNRNSFLPFHNRGPIPTQSTSNLSCTRACFNVTRKTSEGAYGTCNRTACNFAHSLEELNDPMCNFDSRCRFRWDRNGQKSPRSRCQHRHSDETREEWLKRTGRTLPDLPQTCEHTRNPSEQNPRTTKPETKPETKQLGKPNEASVWPRRLKLPSPVRFPAESFVTPDHRSNPDPRLKLSSTHEKEFGDYLPRHPFKFDTSSDEEYSRRRLRSRSRSPRYRKRVKNRSQSPVRSNRIIRVPNESLAKIAIEAAFKQGIYNIKVLIE